MLLNGAAVEDGGVRIWIDCSAKHTEKMLQWHNLSASWQPELKLPVTADKNWLSIKPDQASGIANAARICSEAKSIG
jgi:phosphorylcholine phosphatase